MRSHHHALIFGASHAACMRRAMQRFTPAHANFSANVAAAGVRHLPGGLFVRNVDGSTSLNPAIQNSFDNIRARQPCPEIWMVTALRCNEASRITMYEHTTPFAIATRIDEEERVFGRGQIFSDILFKEILRERLSPLDNELRMLGSLPVAGVIQIAPPPPLRNNDDITELLPESFVEKARAIGLIKEEFRISPPELRKRAWELECEVSEQIARNANAIFLKHDNQFLGTDGLRGKNSAQDAIHGNVNWGLAVLGQIEKSIMSHKTRVDHEPA